MSLITNPIVPIITNPKAHCLAIVLNSNYKFFNLPSFGFSHACKKFLDDFKKSTISFRTPLSAFLSDDIIIY